MNRTWHLYDQATGIFTGRTFSAPDEESLRHNVPEGHGAHEAKNIDHLSQRLDLTNREIVSYQPPAPSADHEWDGVSKRWKLNAAVAAREAERASAAAQIRDLESKALRALIEQALGHKGAKERLEALHNQIIRLRPAVSVT